MNGISFRGQVSPEDLARRFEHVHGEKIDPPRNLYFSARRKFIDTLLREEANKAGADLEEEFLVEDLIIEKGMVCGIIGQSKNGRSQKVRAKVVIGADGRNSTVARILNLPKIDIREACSFACYSYFENPALGSEGRIEKKGRLALATIPTNDGAHMVLVYGPKEYYSAFCKNREVNFQRTLELINPEISCKVLEGVRKEGFYSTDDMTGFMRPAAGAGFALIGDAACFKDQVTASGMTHAFRDAELLGELLSKALHQGAAINLALEAYKEKHFVDMSRYYDFTCQQAEMNALRPEEQKIFEALSESSEQSDRFIAMFCDVLPVRDFFGEQNIKKLLASHLHKPSPKLKLIPQTNPYIDTTKIDKQEALALSLNCADFAQVQGPDLLKRTENYHEWYSARLSRGTFQYSRTLKTFPGSRTELFDDAGRRVRGINFASQDYLGLGSHPALKAAAIEAIEKFGPHSAGSPMVIGNTTISQKLEQKLGQLLKMEHVLLYPTGWAAGYGAIAGLVRAHDHVIMDRLTHSCLQNGTMAATKNIIRTPHLDNEAVKATLKDIRARDVRNGILVVTEGIFSMDADAPRLEELQKICHEHQATLLVDVAHDLGASGPGGTGQIGIQGMLGKIDLVMGSFSKSFACNGGFLASRSFAVKQYAKMFGSSHMFSNALSPVQSAVALASTQIIQSSEGDERRTKLLEVVRILRDKLNSQGLTCIGQPGAIVPVLIGDEKTARICHRLLQERNVAAMILEYPVVAIGASRFRLQVMASHTAQEARDAAQVIAEVVMEARNISNAI